MSEIELTPEETEVILRMRRLKAEKLARATYKLHILKTAWEFETWLEENGVGESFSTFIDEFGYQPQGKESVSALYQDVIKLCAEARWTIDGADA